MILKLARLSEELARAEVTRVDLLGQIAAQESSGPFTADGCMILCEDTGVMFNLAHESSAPAIAAKLNQLAGRLQRLREAIQKHRDNVYAEDADDERQWNHDDRALYAAIEAAKGAENE